MKKRIRTPNAKRIRTPKAKPGQLLAKWGKLSYDEPYLCYAWGEGVPKCDASLLDYALTGKRYNLLKKQFDKSFMEELEDRGYDITTLKFSINKKKS